MNNFHSLIPHKIAKSAVLLRCCAYEMEVVAARRYEKRGPFSAMSVIEGFAWEVLLTYLFGRLGALSFMHSFICLRVFFILFLRCRFRRIPPRFDFRREQQKYCGESREVFSSAGRAIRTGVTLLPN